LPNVPNITSRNAKKEEIRFPRRLRTEENMVRNPFFAALAVALIAGMGYANPSSPNRVLISVSKTPASSGRQMYENYCAPCHGVDGRGNGPVAASLKKQPADLALLSKNNGGKFPSSHVMSVLEFGIVNPSHGTSDMPVWGPVLGHTGNDGNDVGLLRMSNLSRYLQTLQAK
jgi:mono/diheme cytochrome c family protein